MKVLRNLVIFFLALVFFATRSLEAVTELQFKNGLFNVSWKHLPSSQEIEFELHVKSVGYIALGLTKTNTGMQGLDIVFVAVNGNVKTIKDMNVNAEKKPSEDSQQDYTLIIASESNGKTMARVKRKLVTSDTEDLKIQPGDKVYLAWATSPTSDTLEYHYSHRNYSSMMYELVPAPSNNVNVTSTTPATEPSTTMSATPTTTGDMIKGSSILCILAILFALTAQ